MTILFASLIVKKLSQSHAGICQKPKLYTITYNNIFNVINGKNLNWENLASTLARTRGRAERHSKTCCL